MLNSLGVLLAALPGNERGKNAFKDSLKFPSIQSSFRQYSLVIVEEQYRSYGSRCRRFEMVDVDV